MDDEVVDDVLPGWRSRTLRLRPDATSRAGGPAPVATLVSPPAGDRPRARVLYLHGFVDYFFHPHVADALARHGYELHGLDLRDHGRSIRPGRAPNVCADLAVYAEEIDAAARLLRADDTPLVLLGHSTGGLTAALWADARPGALAALVLNSPWLDLQGSWAERHLLAPLAGAAARWAPGLVVSHLSPYYGRALHRDTGGEWDYDLTWKPHEGFPVTAGFLRAVRRGQRRVAHGLSVDCPVLVVTSTVSGPADRPHEALLTSDSVLDVRQMAARAPLLGADVTLERVDGGAHDLALSPEPARSRYLAEVTGFLDHRLSG